MRVLRVLQQTTSAAVLLCLFSLLFTSAAPAQLTTPFAPGSLSGTVVDPSGAVIPQAVITVLRNGSIAKSATADSLGRYAVNGLTPGLYTVEAHADGFRVTRKEGIRITAANTLALDLTLNIDVQQEQVEVSDSALDSSPDHNASALVLKGDTLDALSDNPDELQQQLQALAAANPEGGTQLYVDGFSGGNMPPKSAIREIRINQNPYSAQYDSLGYGRIEIFTKPGADKLHGDFWASGNDSPWNSLNPFVKTQPPYHSYMLEGDANGPINKFASYFASVFRRNAVDDSIINAEVLDASLNQTPYTQAVSNSSDSTNMFLRGDVQWGTVQTVSLRYQLNRNSQTNGGLGQFSLLTQAFNGDNTSQTLQFSDTQAYGAKVLNETRFQYIRSRNQQTPSLLAPTIVVQGAFTGGGNNTGVNRDAQDRYEFQDYLHISHGKHELNLGGRLRAVRDSNYSTANFNGQYTFATLTAYQITQRGLQSGMTPAAIRAAGGGASLFTQTQGTPSVIVSMIDTGLYAEDDWKLKPNITFSYGLRFETQTDIPDHADLAPRFGLAWSIPGPKNKPPRAVIRTGYGWFYQRFGSTNILQSRRQNGLTERALVVNSPDFYPAVCSTSPAACSGADTTVPTIFRISSALRSPNVMNGNVSVDKPLGKLVSVSVNYSFAQGRHLFLTRNANAPLPGTFNLSDPTSGTRPLDIDENIYEYSSEGASFANRLIVNGNLNSKRGGLWGYYMLAKYQANTAGIGSFPSDQYDLHQDYGRGSYDARDQGAFGGYLRLPARFTVNPFVVYRSSLPFNITVGQDLNGDTQFNDRPAFATDLTRPSVVHTRWGTFDTQPLSGQTIIPINYGKGPGQFVANLRLTKNFNFGPALPQPPAPTKPAPAPSNSNDAKANPPSAPAPAAKPVKKQPIDRKYTLGFSLSSSNILNHVNLAQPVGVLGSPLFGTSTAISSPFGSSTADRSVNIETFFRF